MFGDALFWRSGGRVGFAIRVHVNFVFIFILGYVNLGDALLGRNYERGGCVICAGLVLILVFVHVNFGFSWSWFVGSLL